MIENDIKNIGAKIRRLKKKVLIHSDKSISREISKLEKERFKLHKQTDSYKALLDSKKALQKEKRRISDRNRRLLKKLDGLSGRSRDVLLSKIERNNVKKSKIDSKIFKKSDSFYLLKKNKRDLSWENANLKRAISQDRSLSKTDKMNSYKKMFNNNLEIDQLNEIIGSPVKQITSDGLSYDYSVSASEERVGEPDELLPWELVQEIQNKVSTGRFKKVLFYYPSGFNIEVDSGDLLRLVSSLEDYESEVIKITDLHKGKTPKIPVFYDYYGEKITIG